MKRRNVLKSVFSLFILPLIIKGKIKKPLTITKFEITETPLVSVPANIDAILTKVQMTAFKNGIFPSLILKIKD